MIVGFQGVAGAFSQEAARALGASATRGYPSFAALCAAVERGALPYAVLPVENSVVGVIAAAREALARARLAPVAERLHRIEQALIGAPGAAVSDVRRVLSHPVALAQCSLFLGRLGVRAEPYYDTAAAVRRVAAAGEMTHAAIGPLPAAELYGAAVLARAVQDVAANYTRFWLVARTRG